jgi:hypothetical protein
MDTELTDSFFRRIVEIAALLSKDNESKPSQMFIDNLAANNGVLRISSRISS